MAVRMIDAFASDDFRADVVPRLATMEQIASYCLTEPGAGSDAGALSTRARRDGDAYVIDGVKQFISGAGASDWYVTMTRTGADGPGGVTAIAVPAPTPGMSFGANERKMGWNAQPTRQVIFENCRVPVSNRLGSEGEGFRIAMKGLDGGRLNIAACSLGGAKPRSSGRSPTWPSGRRSERRSTEFQALQFRLADMATELEAARALLHKAARSLDAGDPDATQLVAMAKRFATDAGSRSPTRRCNSTAATAISRITDREIVRDLRVHRILEGTNEIMRVIIARGLIAGAR